MAKGNLFLGTGINSVGDVTLMRRNGAQVSRVRVRKIANPKSDGQATQRSYVASVPKFYSPLSVALEKSWEGKNKQDSYSAFMKENIARVKDAGFAIPKGSGFWPIPAKLSNGTIAAAEVTVDDIEDQFKIALGQSNVTTMGTLATALEDKYGLQDGDQVTFIGTLISSSSEDFYYYPTYIRFYLDSTSTDLIANIGLLTVSVTGSDLVIGNSDNNLIGFGVIFSRYENGVWRRSTSYLNLLPSFITAMTSTAARRNARQSYQQEEVTPASRVYLNGSTAQADANALVLKLANNEEVTITSLQIVSGTFTSGETTETAQVYQLKSADNQSYYLKCDNQRSDYYGLAFMPNGTSSSIFSTSNLAGATTSNILVFDSTANNAKTQEFWGWMEAQGVSVIDLSKYFAPSV